MNKKQIKQFDDFLKTQLNSAQKKAVIHENGPLLVVAGAGSGKTRVITARITNLILKKNIDPSEIVALTFTNKAAQEMLERIAHFLGSDYELPFIGTFHSYCVRILKKNQDLLDNPFFSILDETDQRKLISGILQRNNLQKQVTPKSIGYQISQLKNSITDPTKPPQYPINNPFFEEVYAAYEKEKTISKCLDFDDLLLEVLKLFKKQKKFKESFQNTIKHILS